MIMLYYAFEVTTDGAYDLHVDQSENTLNNILNNLKVELEKDGEEIETIAIGTVEAENVEAALNKIRAGEWQHSQKN